MGKWWKDWVTWKIQATESFHHLQPVRWSCQMWGGGGRIRTHERSRRRSPSTTSSDLSDVGPSTLTPRCRWHRIGLPMPFALQRQKDSVTWKTPPDHWILPPSALNGRQPPMKAATNVRPQSGGGESHLFSHTHCTALQRFGPHSIFHQKGNGRRFTTSTSLTEVDSSTV